MEIPSDAVLAAIAAARAETEAPAEAPVERKPDKAPRDQKPPEIKLNRREATAAARVETLYNTLAMWIFMVAPADATVLSQQAHDRSIEVIRVARHHPGLMKAIENMGNGNDYLAFAGGHLVLMHALLLNHGINIPGVIMAKLVLARMQRRSEGEELQESA